MATVICWFHQDLRIGDHPALDAAIKAAEANCATVVPLYILDDAASGRWAMGGASRWWLHHSLTDLNQGLSRLGAGLVVRCGDAEANKNNVRCADAAVLRRCLSHTDDFNSSR